MEKILCTDLEHVKTIKGLAIYLTDHFQKEFVLDGEEHYLRLGVKKHEDSVPKYFIDFGFFGFELLPDVIDKEIASYLQEVIEFIIVSNRNDWFKKSRYYLVIMRGQDGNCMYLSKSNASGEDFEIGYGNEESICTHEENQFTKDEVYSVIDSACTIQGELGYPSNQLRDLIWANKVEVIE